MSGESIDRVFRNVGVFRKWQILVAASIIFCVAFVENFSVMTNILIAIPPDDYHCKLPPGATINGSIPKSATNNGYEQCLQYANSTERVTEPCRNGRTFYSHYTSIFTEFDLVCERVELEATNHLLYGISRLFSLIISGILVDKFGRKPILLLGLAINFVSTFTQTFSPNIYVLWAIGAVRGFALSIITIPNSLLNTELFVVEARGPVFIISRFMRSIGLFTLILLSYFITDWRILLAVMSIPSLMGIYTAVFVTESPNWLLRNKKYCKAVKIFKHAAKINKMELSPKVMEILKFEYCSDTTKTTSKTKKVTLSKSMALEVPKNITPSKVQPIKGDLKKPTVFKNEESTKQILRDLLKSKTLLKYCVFCVIIWNLMVGLGYGTTLYIRLMPGSFFLNYTFYSIMEIIAGIICLTLLPRCGRKTTLIIATAFLILVFSLQVVSTTLTHIDLSGLTIATTMLARVGTNIVWSILVMYTTELFPTSVRGFAMTVCQCVCQTPTFYIPYLLNLSTSLKWLPGVLFIFFAAGSLILLLFLPETKGRPIQQTIEEFEIWSKTNQKRKEIMNIPMKK